MSPASYRAAPPRVGKQNITWGAGDAQIGPPETGARPVEEARTSAIVAHLLSTPVWLTLLVVFALPALVVAVLVGVRLRGRSSLHR